MTQNKYNLEQKYPVKSKKHKQKIIKNWIIAIVVLAIIAWGFVGMPALELKSKSIEILKSILTDFFIRIGVMYIFLLVKIYYVDYLKRLRLR